MKGWGPSREESAHPCARAPPPVQPCTIYRTNCAPLRSTVPLARPPILFFFLFSHHPRPLMLCLLQLRLFSHVFLFVALNFPFLFFVHSPSLCSACSVRRDGWTKYDGSGLKGTVAEWASALQKEVRWRERERASERGRRLLFE